MSFYIIRNYTVEHLFGDNHDYSHYNSFNPNERDLSSYDAVVNFMMPPLSGSYKERVQGMKASIQTLNLMISEVKSRLILFTMPYIGAFHTIEDTRLQQLVSTYNDTCYQAATIPNVFCIDFAVFTQRIPSDSLVDWKHFYMSQIALNPKYSAIFKDWFDLQMSAILAKRKKCIILDLDNTLWGGVIGEDGLDGIDLGGGYPGNVYYDAQKLLLSAYENGVILAICSKNNEADAMDAIERHPNMVLRDRHFAIKRINWENKAENVQSIAASLNIGLDSLVFIDDNPSERALVKSFVPEVTVPDFPEKPYLIPVFINSVLENEFTLYQLTEEDKKKTDQYRQNAVRDEFKSSYTDYNQYLIELKMILEVSKANKLDIPRVAQLTQKTNQFNLTSKRYSESDIKNFIDEGNLVLIAKVKDRFGEYGLTGVCIVKINGNEAEIDTLLMSCRVIGREVENEYICQVLAYLKRLGIRSAYSQYIKTKKNAMVKDFYLKSGFSVQRETEQDTAYVLVLDNYDVDHKDIIEVVWKDEEQD
ncbi:MAG: HAD-IIIC family phosphatase [Fermentimonas sp.]|nr:HAD-IIIC family phosphatase [Fermentimonas sp.]